MGEQHPTDEELAALVQQGDQRAFSLLFFRYQPRILRYGRTFLFQYQDTEDAVQETFIKTYTNIKSFDSSKKFSSWIYRIAHNTFINFIRKKGREPVSFFDLDTLFQFSSLPEPAHERDIEQFQLKEMIASGLQALEPKYREPLVLYYMEERSYKEIADIMHIPVATIGVRISRAKNLIRKLPPFSSTV